MKVLSFALKKEEKDVRDLSVEQTVQTGSANSTNLHQNQNKVLRQPNSLLEWARDNKITKSEYLLLTVLLYVEAKYAHAQGMVFEHSDKQVVGYRRIGKNSIRKARNGLKQKGYVWHKYGSREYNTAGQICQGRSKYKILIHPVSW